MILKKKIETLIELDSLNRLKLLTFLSENRKTLSAIKTRAGGVSRALYRGDERILESKLGLVSYARNA